MARAGVMLSIILPGCSRQIHSANPPVDTFAWHIDTSPAPGSDSRGEPEVRCEFVVFPGRILLYVTVQNTTPAFISVPDEQWVEDEFDGSTWTVMWNGASEEIDATVGRGRAASSPWVNISMGPSGFGNDESAQVAGRFGVKLHEPFRVICGVNWKAHGETELRQSFSSPTELVVSRQMLQRPAPVRSWRTR